MKPLLEIVDVSKNYGYRKSADLAVKKLSLKIYHEEIFGLVGESGSGKSTLAKMILMLEKPSEGQIFFNNRNIFQLSSCERKEMRKQIQIVFQNPYSALNPRMTLHQILNEPFEIHHLYHKMRSKKIHDLIHMVGLEKNQLHRYPYQFSGGQRQRICIARALAVEPSLLVCDEPLSALDLPLQAQILHLLKDCQKNLGLTMLFISHDLAVVDMIADKVAVMHQGQIVEEGFCNHVFHHPQHPYTQCLVEAVTRI